MVRIPKKVLDRFSRAVPKLQKVSQVAKDRDVNESDTVSILKGVLSDVLGYDRFLEVTSEFAIRGTYCDLAIKVDDKVQFLVEAKAIGIELKDSHLRQAVNYGANHGVQWIILTNAAEWKVYRIRFEQPIAFDLVCSFDLLALNPRCQKDQEHLFMLAKEGLAKSARETFYERVQSVNRYVIGSLILTEPVLAVIRRELKKLADEMKIDVAEVEQLVRTEVLKREIVEGEEAVAAQARVSKIGKRSAKCRKKRTTLSCRKRAEKQDKPLQPKEEQSMPQ